MSTSQRTFNQVKSILGKLDQRIDNLRAARTTERVISPDQPGLSTTIGAGIGAGQPAAAATPLASRPVPAPIPMPAAPLAQPRSVYGRATPIRPTGS